MDISHLSSLAALGKIMADQNKITKNHALYLAAIQNLNLAQRYPIEKYLAQQMNAGKLISPVWSHNMGQLMKAEKALHTYLNPPPIKVQDLIGRSILHHAAITHNILGISKNADLIELLTMMSKMTSSSLASAITHSAKQKSWEEWEEFEKQLDEAEQITESIASEGFNEVQLAQLKTLILAHHPKSKHTRFDLITIWLGLIFSVLGFSKDLWDIIKESNEEPVQTKANAQIQYEGLVYKIDQQSAQASIKRYAIRDTKFYNKPSTKSRCKGIVRANQEVTVMSQNHKWIGISFIDDFSGSLTAGYVQKKYFKLMK